MVVLPGSLFARTESIGREIAQTWVCVVGIFTERCFSPLSMEASNSLLGISSSFSFNLLNRLTISYLCFGLFYFIEKILRLGKLIKVSCHFMSDDPLCVFVAL